MQIFKYMTVYLLVERSAQLKRLQERVTDVWKTDYIH